MCPLRRSESPTSTRAVFDDPCDRATVERAQLVFPYQSRDQACVEPFVFLVAVESVIEVGGDLEQARKIRVVLAQQVVEGAVADEDDLDVQHGRLRLE